MILDKLEARGKPSTWLPRGGLVDHIFFEPENQLTKIEASESRF